MRVSTVQFTHGLAEYAVDFDRDGKVVRITRSAKVFDGMLPIQEELKPMVEKAEQIRGFLIG